MDLENAWKQMDDGSREDLASYMQGIDRKTSIHPLQKIRKGLMTTTVWGILISLAYVYVMYRFPYWQVLLCFSIVMLFNIYFIWMGFRLYRQIPDHVDAGHSLLEELEMHHRSVTRWMDLQLFSAQFVYPVAAAAGFMVGGMLGSGKTINEFFSKPVIPIALVLVIAIITPLGMWLAKKLFAISYVPHLDQLKEQIDALRRVG